jgi:hypothetical protein
MRKAKILIPTVLFPLILLSLIIAAVFTSPEPPEPVSVGPIIMSQIACLADSSDQITVVLEPTYEAIADKVYNIEVKKGDVLRAITSVSWAQQELQAKQAKGFQFPTTADEFQFYAMDRNQLGYAWKNLSEEFTVIEYAEGTSTKYKVPFSAVAPSPPSTPFNWWFVWIPLVGLVLLVVYIRILTSYIQEKRDYEIAEEQKRREQEEIEKQKRVEFAREGKATQCPKCHKWHAQVDDGSKVIKKEQRNRKEGNKRK